MARDWMKDSPRLVAALKLQASVFGAIVVCALTVSFAIGEVVTNNDQRVHSFALPVLPSQEPWSAEVAQLSDRVSAAFGLREDVADEFSEWILEAATRQEFDPDLIAGLIATESSFRKSVRSHVGAVGPAQVRPDYWARFCGTKDLLDPEQNIYCGAQILAYKRDRCGDETCALQAYNIGLYSKRAQAAARYVNKVDRHRAALANIAAL